MKNKTSKRSTQWKLLLPVILLVGLVVTLSVTGVFGSLADTTSVVKNEFQVASVASQANKDFTVKNTGNIPVLIRAKLVVNWLDENGNILFQAPEGASYSLSPAGSGWTQFGGTPEDPTSGFWYCNSIIPADGTTQPLFTSVNALGGTLQVYLLTEAIQATPAAAIREAWGMGYENGTWAAISD